MTVTQSDPQDSFEKNTSLPYHDLDIEGLQSEIAEALHKREYPREGVFAVRLAVEEALVNAYRHGNQRDASKIVTFTCRIDSECAFFEVADEGPGFDISSVPDPTDEANLEIPSGRGLLLMREYMSLLEFIEPGNRLRMTYHRVKS